MSEEPPDGKSWFTSEHPLFDTGANLPSRSADLTWAAIEAACDAIRNAPPLFSPPMYIAPPHVYEWLQRRERMDALRQRNRRVYGHARRRRR